ncbi:MAG: Deoxycytidine monophosphate (dCMP) deaminase [Trizodia sp. TS-e1964]|nr:MAG: Deoxycytidine monophosphate (dCMP) deaminase [Trizodia sp. TS-e1964]
MLIGICGGICSGKKAVASYLIEHQGFTNLTVTRGPLPPLENCFKTLAELLAFVMTRWRSNFVIWDIDNMTEVNMLIDHPFFLLVGVEAPVSERFKRYNFRQKQYRKEPASLEAFVELDESMFYGPSGTVNLIERAALRVMNSIDSLEALRIALSGIKLMSESRLRPDWDQYFMQLASLAAKRSNCMKRRVGCVLVREHRVISTGYNGTPRGFTNCNEGGCPRCNAGLESGADLATCLCIHAEENALLEAGRERIGEGTVLYCDT